MVEISSYGSGEGPGWVTAPGYSTAGYSRLRPVSGGAKRVRPGEATVSGYATTIGLSAFLLFLIQPMIAKLLLPGGWTPIPSGGRYAASPSGGRITTGAAPSEGPTSLPCSTR